MEAFEIFKNNVTSKIPKQSPEIKRNQLKYCGTIWNLKSLITVWDPGILRNHMKPNEIRWNLLNHGESYEIKRNHMKSNEIIGDLGKSLETMQSYETQAILWNPVKSRGTAGNPVKSFWLGLTPTGWKRTCRWTLSRAVGWASWEMRPGL